MFEKENHFQGTLLVDDRGTAMFAFAIGLRDCVTIGDFHNTKFHFFISFTERRILAFAHNFSLL